MAKLQKKKIPSAKQNKVVDDEELKIKREKAAKAIQERVALSEQSKNVAAEPGTIEKAITFLKDVKSELKKVAWPNKKQAAGSTVVVIILVFVIAMFLGVVDIGLSKLIQMVLA